MFIVDFYPMAYGVESGNWLRLRHIHPNPNLNPNPKLKLNPKPKLVS